MSSVGSRIRRAFGPYERSVADLYRRCFVDLDELSRCIRDWTHPRSIVEIGCGEGALAERLTQAFPSASYLGIDIIPHVGRLYQGSRERVVFRQISSRQLVGERSRQFDLVVIADVLHHVERPLRASVLESARDLMTADGHLVLKDWVKRRSAIHAACYFADVYIGGDRNVEYMTLEEQKTLIEFTFGPGAIKKEAFIAPWRHNCAFLVSKYS